MIRLILNIYRFLFLRKALYRFNLALHKLSMRGIGLLNHESSELSGENFLIRRLTRGKRDLVVFDVGANAGAYSASVKALCPSAHVVAFEPHPRVFAHLKSDADKTGYFAFNTACGDKNGQSIIYDYVGHGGSGHGSLYKGVIEDLHHGVAAPLTIDTVTLDSFVAGRGLNKIDLLKIDTEGSELAVLMGARQLLGDNLIDVIHFEFNEMNVFSRVFMRDFIALLEQYRLFRMLPDGVVELTPYQPSSCELFAFQNIAAIRRDRPDLLKALC